MGIRKASIRKRGENYEWQGMINVRYFEALFEKKFLDQTLAFYKKKAEEWMILTVHD